MILHQVTHGVMLTEKFPSSEFKKCKIKNINQIIDNFCYIVIVKFKNIRCKYYNTFISQSKCNYLIEGSYDNGRVIKAKELEIVVTDVDLKLIFETYDFDSYEFIEVYWSYKDYLPIEFIKFILEKYNKKTKLKGVPGKDIEYALEKALFNALYGMTVTNNIRDTVIYDNEKWEEIPLNNDEILNLLQKEKEKSFLSYSYGVYVTAYARRNLLENLIKLDNYQIYADTDSLKIKEGYDKKIIEDYNKKVIEKIKKVCSDLKLNYSDFSPKDINGNTHTIGLFENESEKNQKFTYKEFITLGAKKYAYKDFNNKIHITVSGVPKEGAKSLKKLEDFKNDFIFEYKYTNKNSMCYNDNQFYWDLKDYNNKIYRVTEKYGICLFPCEYTLGISNEYADLIEENSSKHAIFKE